MKNFSQTTNFIWSVADLLRGDYKQSDYGKVILSMTIIRRLDCVLIDTKKKVLDQMPRVQAMNVQNTDPILNNITGYNFHNHSKYDFDTLIADPENIAANFRNYINGFSESARDILDNFNFEVQINKLDEANLLFMVVKRFQEVNLHPGKIDNTHMGYIYEELIRKFSELSNETAGEHFTPREVIRLMVNLIFLNDHDILTKKGIVKTLYDVCGGTGGMLSVAEEYLNELNPDARLEVFGQELNPESYATCKSDMLIKGQKADNIKLGNSLSNDRFSGQQFDYMLTNPPFGVEWKKVAKEVKDEHEKSGFGGRFGAGLPRISDGSLLFLMHLISKMKQNGSAGSRIGIVLNGSPLFTGGAGSGESNIRKWIIENDMLEAIIALPDQLFYNTGISTYLWFVTNRKAKERKGKVQLINAVSMFEKMSKSLGNKRNIISAAQIEDITRIYGEFTESKYCKIFDNEEFGYTRITVERPLIGKGKVVKDNQGNPKPDPSLRDNEDVPLKGNIEEYFRREVLPHVPDAWIDHSKSKVGYEINFNRYFYEYKPLRSLDEIRADILKLEEETSGMIEKVLED
ncbi:MAG TPA: class I SAM-dependent DNA methyltransferase [Bacteroidales bacterium]|nr:class I SAM-dependent DNA methyltransferase [Bacteroidales bacterium]